MVTHYDWKSQRQACPACGWTGLGCDTEVGETFSDGADYHCPGCGHRFGYVAYPLLSESLSDPRAPQSDRTFAEIVVGRAPHQDMARSAKTLARAHLRKLVAWLLASLFGSAFAGWISAWAGERNDWEGQFVQVAFGLAGAIAFFTFFVFCVLIYSWLSNYKYAMRDSSELASDRDFFLQRYRDVFGPIPWR